MYKLTVIAGPNRGSTYAVKDGQTSIGRQSGNSIVLDSSKVSKKHCVLVVSNGKAVVKDEGSSNGTFVNGVLTQAKPLQPGDKIAVGEFVFQITQSVSKAHRPAAALQGYGNIVQLPGFQAPPRPQYYPVGQLPGMGGRMGGEMGQEMSGGLPGGGGGMDPGDAGSMRANGPPSDLAGKILWNFDKHVMPLFYGLNFRNEWHTLCALLMALFILGTLVLTVYPLVEANRKTVVAEVARRAQFMAKQIAERNAGALAANAETRTEIGSLANEEGVRVAVLADLDLRIIAPSTQLNQYFTVGAEAIAAEKARSAFRNGRETGFRYELDAETVIAIEPVKILNPQLAKNVVVAMAVVSIDTTLSVPNAGEIGMVYSETLIFSAILGALLLMILYRMTLKPFQVLNDDIDRALKGEINQVTHEFRIEELNPLWDVINSTVQRVARAGSITDAGSASSGGGSVSEDSVGALRMMGDAVEFGIAMCDADRKVVYLNGAFEDVSGLRLDSVEGQELASVARDQAFGSLVSDLFERAASGGSTTSEDFDFSGVAFKVGVTSLGSMGSSAKGYVLILKRTEG